MSILGKLKNNEEMGFKDIIVSKKKLLRRVENLCLYFKENMPKYKNSLKRVGTTGLDYSTGKTKLENYNPSSNKAITTCRVNRDENGNIIYPIFVSPTLKILDLGVVEYERSAFHSSRNIFPIGFKSCREYTSMVDPNRRCDYICEILDGGHSPIFKVTCQDDPGNPIVKDASSGAWIDVFKRINDL